MGKRIIAVVMRDFQSGGCQNQVSLYLKYLNKKKYDIHLFTLVSSPEFPEYSKDKFSSLPITIHTIQKKNAKNDILKTCFWLGSELHKIKVDIVISFQWRSDLILSVTSKLFGFKNIIMTERGDRVSNQYHLESYRVFMDKLLVVKRPIYFVANSIKGCQALKNIGVEDKKIKYIPNGIEFDCTTKKIRTELSDYLSVKKNKGYFIFGFVGNFKSMKGHLNLIDAVAEIVKKQYNKFIICCVGDGDLRRQVEEKIARNNLHDFFVFSGNQSNAENIIPYFDCGMMLSETEGFPNVLLEYSKYLVPILSTNVGNVPIMFQNNKDALLFDYGNHDQLVEKILYILDNKDILNVVAHNAYEKTNSLYNIKEVVRQYEDLFDEIIYKKNENWNRYIFF